MHNFTPDGLIVHDANTRLTWTRDDVTEDHVTFAEAEAAIVKLNAERFAGFDDWRLPTVDELFALADRSRHDPAIDTDAFPSCKIDWYWTSTASPSGCAWVVDFDLGGANSGHRDNHYRVRAVRG